MMSADDAYKDHELHPVPSILDLPLLGDEVDSDSGEPAKSARDSDLDDVRSTTRNETRTRAVRSAGQESMRRDADVLTKVIVC